MKNPPSQAQAVGSSCFPGKLSFEKQQRLWGTRGQDLGNLACWADFLLFLSRRRGQPSLRDPEGRAGCTEERIFPRESHGPVSRGSGGSHFSQKSQAAALGYRPPCPHPGPYQMVPTRRSLSQMLPVLRLCTLTWVSVAL